MNNQTLNKMKKPAGITAIVLYFLVAALWIVYYGGVFAGEFFQVFGTIFGMIVMAAVWVAPPLFFLLKKKDLANKAYGILAAYWFISTLLSLFREMAGDEALGVTASVFSFLTACALLTSVTLLVLGGMKKKEKLKLVAFFVFLGAMLFYLVLFGLQMGIYADFGLVAWNVYIKALISYLFAPFAIGVGILAFGPEEAKAAVKAEKEEDEEEDEDSEDESEEDSENGEDEDSEEEEQVTPAPAFTGFHNNMMANWGAAFAKGHASKDASAETEKATDAQTEEAVAEEAPAERTDAPAPQSESIPVEEAAAEEKAEAPVEKGVKEEKAEAPAEPEKPAPKAASFGWNAPAWGKSFAFGKPAKAAEAAPAEKTEAAEPAAESPVAEQKAEEALADVAKEEKAEAPVEKSVKEEKSEAPAEPEKPAPKAASFGWNAPAWGKSFAFGKPAKAVEAAPAEKVEAPVQVSESDPAEEAAAEEKAEAIAESTPVEAEQPAPKTPAFGWNMPNWGKSFGSKSSAPKKTEEEESKTEEDQ